MNEAITHIDEIRFTILGPPKAQKRHRDVSRDRTGNPLPFIRRYDPSAADKDWLLMQVLEHKPAEPWLGPIELHVVWFLARPKSHYRTGKYAGVLRDDAPTFVFVKPDDDNLEKLFRDALNGVFYRDDAQIARVFKAKVYSDNGILRTEALLRRLPLKATHPLPSLAGPIGYLTMTTSSSYSEAR